VDHARTATAYRNGYWLSGERWRLWPEGRRTSAQMLESLADRSHWDCAGRVMRSEPGRTSGLDGSSIGHGKRPVRGGHGQARIANAVCKMRKRWDSAKARAQQFPRQLEQGTRPRSRPAWRMSRPGIGWRGRGHSRPWSPRAAAATCRQRKVGAASKRALSQPELRGTLPGADRRKSLVWRRQSAGDTVGINP